MIVWMKLAEFYNVLGKLLDIASSKYNEIIVVGDFNVDLLTSSHPARKLSNLFRDNGMHQIVNNPTRVTTSTSTLIDHVYVTHKDRTV